MVDSGSVQLSSLYTLSASGILSPMIRKVMSNTIGSEVYNFLHTKLCHPD